MATVFRPVSSFLPFGLSVRSMATLKEIRTRLKSVQSIQKITKSMKMVSAAKFARAERELRPARTYGNAAQAFHESSTIEVSSPKHLIIAVTSDRGLCGGIHSNMGKHIRSLVAELPADETVKIVTCGDKLRALFQRNNASQMALAFSELGKQPMQFGDAAFVAQKILEAGVEYDKATVVFNKFKSVISYAVTEQPVFSLDAISGSEGMTLYDDVDSDILRNYHEFSLASLIYWAMKESATSEQSARMTAMDSASKNAGEMIEKLTLTFNRTRQAVITRELIEIISGAAALD
ncbi:ATP synthase subunit gamma, mitochondrial-like [Corticium candelabrum]|uniref:ATP synthase subunit gamma, mitochondrial-like n=1 Tax=Corticium candelabrum TaxID=121492 RepID=UPI002E266888|nr:ATP synthase subunit gamma, mitochondrial-like [Corticium candelabrum]